MLAFYSGWRLSACAEAKFSSLRATVDDHGSVTTFVGEVRALGDAGRYSPVFPFAVVVAASRGTCPRQPLRCDTFSCLLWGTQIRWGA